MAILVQKYGINGHYFIFKSKAGTFSALRLPCKLLAYERKIKLPTRLRLTNASKTSQFHSSNYPID